MTKLPEYSEVWINCQCGQRIGGTALAKQIYEFTCLGCSRVHVGHAPESGKTLEVNGPRPLPAWFGLHWNPISDAPWNEEILVTGSSGCVTPYERFFINAYRIKDWHQGQWHDVTGTRLSKQGWEPTHFAA